MSYSQEHKSAKAMASKSNKIHIKLLRNYARSRYNWQLQNRELYRRRYFRKS